MTNYFSDQFNFLFDLWALENVVLDDGVQDVIETSDVEIEYEHEITDLLMVSDAGQQEAQQVQIAWNPEQ